MIDVIRYKDRLRICEEDLNKILTILEVKKEDDSSFFTFIQGIDEKYLCNSKVCLVIMEALQLSNSENIYSTYDLKDIESVYDLMLKYNPNDLRIWMDAIYFNANVLNNEEKVQELINKLLCKINSVSEQIDYIRKEL